MLVTAHRRSVLQPSRVRSRGAVCHSVRSVRTEVIAVRGESSRPSTVTKRICTIKRAGKPSGIVLPMCVLKTPRSTVMFCVSVKRALPPTGAS